MGLQTLPLETQAIFLESVVTRVRKTGVLELIFSSSKGKRPFLSFACIQEAIFISFRRQICPAASVQRLYIIASLLEFKVYYFPLLPSMIFASHWNVFSGCYWVDTDQKVWQIDRTNDGIRPADLLQSTRGTPGMCMGIERHQLPWDIWLMETCLISSLLPICLTSEAVGQNLWSRGALSSGTLANMVGTVPVAVKPVLGFRNSCSRQQLKINCLLCYVCSYTFMCR